MDGTHRLGLATAVLSAAIVAGVSAPTWAEEVPGQAPPATLGLQDDRGADAAAPEEWPVSFAFDATWAGKYVWRGIVVTEDPVFEPSVEVAVGDLTLNVWANIDTTDVNDFRRQANEIDYTLDYTVFLWEGLTASVGAIHYAFPQAHVFDTTEAYLALAVDVPASPTLTVYQDLDEHDGQYITLGFGHTFEDVWKPSPEVAMSVDLSAQFAWGSRKHNAFYYGSGSGWADTTVGVALPFAVGENVTVTPYVNYMWILDDGVTSALGRDDAFWAGLSFTVSF
jgi:hypothetical protein